MAKINIKGDIIINEWKRYYDYLGWESTCPKDVESIIDKAAEDEPLNVYINSPGGIVEAGQEIYTALRGDPRVNIYITGQACSAASFIAMSGHCEMTPVGLLMVHCASSCVGGNHNELEKAAEMLKAVDRAIAAAYVEKSGMSMEKALEMMEKETWLTANQCIKLGLADGIIYPEQTQAAKAAADAGGVRLTEELIAKIDREIKEKESRKEDLLSDLDFYGV